MASVEIPNRSVFRAAEVCELAGVPAYVLRGWEAEFADLGVAKTTGAPRVYRRADVEKVLRLKHLILVDGLTLAGARRKLAEESPAALAEPASPVSDDDLTSMMDEAARTGIREVKSGLQWIMGVLGGEPAPHAFALTPQPAPARVAKAAKPSAKKPASKGKKR